MEVRSFILLLVAMLACTLSCVSADKNLRLQQENRARGLEDRILPIEDEDLTKPIRPPVQIQNLLQLLGREDPQEYCMICEDKGVYCQCGQRCRTNYDPCDDCGVVIEPRGRVCWVELS